MPINKAWHEAHRMPKRATLEQRVAWHREHRAACACRPVPASLRDQLEAEAPSRRRPSPSASVRDRKAETASSGTSPDPKFARVVAALVSEPGVSFGGKGFGSSGLKCDGKIFAMLAGGQFVAKLPKQRVAELVAQGQGEFFAPSPKRRMQEWLAASASNTRWLALAREALEFARQGR